jgi:hypothetical protein
MTIHEEVVLCTTECRLNLIDCLKQENDRYRAALEWIASSAFCDSCSEASLVARAALSCDETASQDEATVAVVPTSRPEGRRGSRPINPP